MDEQYRAAGVDITAGNQVVELIKEAVESTRIPGVLGGIGGFGGLFLPPWRDYHEPVLVSGTDGVGTKIKVAAAWKRWDTVGIDCVAMCVNDILTQGARPLFFLDYLAVGHLDPKAASEVVRGVAEGCRQAGCALIGGETAEMPGVYAPGELDLAGFAVGIAEKSRLVDGRTIRPGDLVLGLPSSGLHSNGYSLARKVLLEDAGLSADQVAEPLTRTLGEELLEPTRIYVRAVLPLLDKFTIKGMAHITGGGLAENIPRILPRGCAVELDATAWTIPPVFKLIQQLGQITEQEMRRVFNLGIGLMLVVEPGEAAEITAFLEKSGEAPRLIGRVVSGEREVRFKG